MMFFCELFKFYKIKEVFFIIIFKPFQVHDIVKISDDMIGEVMDITLRHTIIKNYQNKMIVIPNAIINKEKVINYNLGEKSCCQWIEIGISYDSDIDLAKHIIREECESHPNLIDNRSQLDQYNNVKKVIVPKEENNTSLLLDGLISNLSDKQKRELMFTLSQKGIKGLINE